MRGIVIVAVLTTIAVAQQPIKPRYEWRQVGSQTMEFNALEGQALPLPSNARVMKVSIDAESGVFVGVISSAKLGAYMKANRPLRHTDFQGVPCGQINLVKGEKACRIDNLGYPAVLYIRDKRAEGTKALALLGGAKMNSQLADRTTKPNKVAVTISIPVCIENCPAQPQQ